ncbi:MAG: ATP-binding protein [Thermodesulfovibrionales bacterium]
MLKHLRAKVLILLIAVSLVALSSALLLRGLMIRDFSKYLEGEREDRIYWIMASLESSFERYAGWNREKLIEDTVWALMLGYDIRILNADKRVMMDTGTAVASLSPMTKRRIASLSELRVKPDGLAYVPYVLFLGGTEIGSIEVALLPPKKEQVFITTSNRLLLISLAALGGLALILGTIFSRTISIPVERLTEGVAAIAGGTLSKRVSIESGDELGRLAVAFNRMADALEKQESLRKRLTANIAHELRTPVSAIRGELEGMIDGMLPVNREGLQSLLAEIGRLRTLLDGIEELSQAEASSLGLRKASFPLAPFLGSVLERFRGLLLEKSISASIDCDQDITVTADPDRLSQIVINLLSNAIKATPERGSIVLSGGRGDHATVIRVEDTGCGIAPIDLPFVFERFYRSGAGGLGLGLTITRELVEAHGGTVVADSIPGRGSVFTVTLPD